MSSSNLIQFQQINEPNNLNFVFPLSRYNQQIFGIKNNFITYNFDINYNILKFYNNKIGVDIGLGYFSTLNSIYKNAKWSFRGYNVNFGIKYYYNEDNSINNEKILDKKQVSFNDTIFINDTLKIREITTNETLQNTSQIKFVNSDTTYNIKKTDDYNLNIITIKNTFNKIEYETTTNPNINSKNLIIPNLELFYSYNNKLTKSYINKINKQITRYNYIEIKDNNFNDFVDKLTNKKDKINNLSFKDVIISNNLSIKDTVVTLDFPDIIFKLDVFSEEAITNCKIIVKAINNDIFYDDTLIYDQYINNKVDINYAFDLNKFQFKNKNFKEIIGNKLTTNYIFGDFRFGYTVVIEDNSGNSDSTLNGIILFETIYNKFNQTNEKYLLITNENKEVNEVKDNKYNLNSENFKLFKDNFKEINTYLNIFEKFKTYELEVKD